MSLSVSNLSHYYIDGDYKRYVLTDINYEFKRGHFYTIMGESGSGKTTLLSLMAGLDTKQSGKIVLDNNEIEAIGYEKYRNSCISVVFQNYNLINYLSAYENVLVALDITSKKTPKDMDKIAYNLLNYLGLDKNKADRPIPSLSGGEQQRVAIARALACDVDYILADEPTGNLDENSQKELIKIFQMLAHQHNKCVIVVTHSPEVAHCSDIILNLQRGQLNYE
ncbi:MAG: ABC transporter ATP-binding protein [Erysipelotrichales bacterium]